MAPEWGKRERETETETETDREKESETERDRDRDRERERERERERAHERTWVREPSIFLLALFTLSNLKLQGLHLDRAYL